MLLTDVSLLDVLGQWGYSEITSPNTRHHYDNCPGIDVLRARRQGGVAYEDLSPDERYHIALQSGSIRNALLVFTIGADLFDLIELDRPTIAKLIVPPNVWHPDSNGQFVPFEHFMTTSAVSANDSRNVTLQGSYSYPEDPLTAGRLYDHPVLLDGYHRAALFWKFGPQDGKLKAYVPQALRDAFGK